MNPPNPTGEPRTRLANAVATFRERNGLTQTALSQRGGPSVPTIRRVERGTPVDHGTLSRLDIGLGWTPGTAAAILDGHNPDLPDTPTPGAGITIGFLPGFESLPPITQERIRAAAMSAALEKLAEIDSGDNG